jgi:lysophospholipase L1-like esterase
MRKKQGSVCKSIWGSIVLLGISLLVSVAMGEGLLRLLGYHGEPQSIMANIYPVDDEVVDWRYRPNSEVFVGKVTLRYNSQGFRDNERSALKPPGTRRILVLGDSVTMGHGVEWPFLFSQVIQARLPSNAEVITIAMGGLNTPQEVHLLEQIGVTYDVDMVILNFVLNDADFPTRYEASKRFINNVDSTIGLFDIKVAPEIKRFLKSSALVYFMKVQVENIKGRLLGQEDTDYFTKVWQSASNRRKIVEGFERLGRLQQRHGFKTVVLIWPILMPYDQYRFKSIHQWVGEEGQRNGFTVIDLLPEFSKHYYRDLQLTAEDNVHPNAGGHAIGAEAFLSWYGSKR